MQQLLRPYATTGVALVGAGLVGVTAVPIPQVSLHALPAPRPDLAPVQQQPNLRLMANTSDVLVTWNELFSNTVANLANLGQHVDSGLVGAQPFDLNFTLGQVLDTVQLGDKSVTTILSGIGIGDLPIGAMVTSLLDGGGAKAAAGGRTRGYAYGGLGGLGSASSASGARSAAGPADAGGAVRADPGQAGSAGEAGTRGADGAPG